MILLILRTLLVVLKFTPSFSASVYGLYDLRETGVHPSLSDHIISQFPGRSLLGCGTICAIKNCTSFRLDVATQNCFLYDVFMSYISPSNEQFYIIPNSPNAAASICPTPRIYNSTFVNVALGKEVYMSPWFNAGSNMVDGTRNIVWPCAQAQWSNHAYMTVDLGQVYSIYSIYILNRKDYEYLFRRVQVLAGETLESLQQVHYQWHALGCDTTIFLPAPIPARYVKFYKDVSGGLIVCEMEVYAII